VKVGIEGEDLVIRLSADELKNATETCPALEELCKEHNNFGAPKVTDLPAWRKEVMRVLVAEAENGSTLIHRMFDRAFQDAVEQGAEGVCVTGA
jgi:hypothetical protein